MFQFCDSKATIDLLISTKRHFLRKKWTKNNGIFLGSADDANDYDDVNDNDHDVNANDDDNEDDDGESQGTLETGDPDDPDDYNDHM